MGQYRKFATEFLQFIDNGYSITQNEINWQILSENTKFGPSIVQQFNSLVLYRSLWFLFVLMVWTLG